MALVLDIKANTKTIRNQMRKDLAEDGAKSVQKLERASVTSATRITASFKRLTNVLGPLGLGLGLVGLVRGFNKVIKAASDTEESINKVKEVFGDASGAVINFSDVAAESLGASRQEALAMTGEIGNLLVAMKFSEEKAGDFSTKMVQLAADLGSFNNVPTVDALNAIRSALVGESEPIRRFGADVRQTRLDQIALGLGLEFTKGKMDAQTKSLAAMEAIMQDTRKAQGDFKRTSDGLANSTKIMEANISDLASTLGTELIPFAKIAVKSLTLLAKGVKDVIEGFTTGTTVDIAKSFGMKEWIAATILGIDQSNAWALETIAASEKVRKDIEKTAKKFEFVGPRQRKPTITKEDPALKRELAIRQEILATIKTQEERQRIINQLKIEGLISLTKEEEKQRSILEKMQASTPILETLERSHFGITELLEDDVLHLQIIADNQARWTEEAEKTKQQLFEAAGILNEIALLATKKKRFSFSRLLGIGAGIASLIPGGQGVAAGLTAASIATRGFQGGGSLIVPGTGSGDRPHIMNLEPGERVDITPRNQVNNNQRIIVNNVFNFQVADEITIKTKVIPIINDYVERQGGKLTASKVA